MPRGLAALSALAGLAALLPWTPAQAIQDCRAAREPIPGAQGQVYKLLLDELRVTGDVDIDALRSALRTKLQSNVEKISLESREIHVIVCANRMPENPSDIANEIEGFTEADVVLEVWGLFDGDEAIFVQAVVPLLSSAAASWPATERYFEDSFLYDAQELELRFLKRLVQDSVHMRSYAAVGIASRALMTGDYDRARKFFCQALVLLDDLTAEAGRDVEHDRLAAFVDGMSLETVERAAADSAYRGTLGTVQTPVGTPCTGETS